MSREEEEAGKAPAGKRRAIRWVVVLAVAAVVIVGFGQKLFDLAFNPWAISVTGGPTLTGVWEGEVRFAANDVRRAVLHLDRRTVGRRCRGCLKIEGSMAVCGADGQTQRYTVKGDPNNWSGSRFFLDLAQPERQPGQHVDFGRLNGEWDADALRLVGKPEAVTVKPDGSASGTASTGSPAAELTIELRRSDRSNAACGG